MVYKLVQRENASGELESVAKKSKDKASRGGRKWASVAWVPAGLAEAR